MTGRCAEYVAGSPGIIGASARWRLLGGLVRAFESASTLDWAASAARCRQQHERFDLLVGHVGEGAGACWIFLAAALRKHWAKEPWRTLHWAGCCCLQNACRRGGAGWGCRVRQGGCVCMPGVRPDSGVFGPGKAAAMRRRRVFCIRQESLVIRNALAVLVAAMRRKPGFCWTLAQMAVGAVHAPGLSCRLFCSQ